MYFSNEEDRQRQLEEGRRTGSFNRSATMPTGPKKPTIEDVIKDKLIKQGVTLGGDQLGKLVAGDVPTITGTDMAGNTTYSDGGVTKPDGSLVKEGSYGQTVREITGDAAAAYQFYKALQSDSTKGKVLGTAGAANTALTANGAYGAGTGSIVGGAISAGSILSSNMTDEQKAKALRRAGEDATANYFTAGLWGAAQTADRALLGGKTDKLRDWNDKTPVIGWGAQLGDKVTTKALGLFGSKKGKDQVGRDGIRAWAQANGFFGDPADKDDWTLDNADGSSFDVGKDGGARLDDGRRFFDVDVEKQGKQIGLANPLAYIMAKGDKARSTDMAGYLTNTIMQGKGGEDYETSRLNALDKYQKAGFKTAADAQNAIKGLVDAGSLDQATADAFNNGINDVYGASKPKPTTTTTPTTTTRQPAAKPKTPTKAKPKNEKPVSLVDVVPTFSKPIVMEEPDNEPTDDEMAKVNAYKQMLESMAQRRNV